MAAITDLTWTQLQAELPADTITVVGGKVVIDAGLLAGLELDSLADTGVLTFGYKLLRALRAAQDTVNVDAAEGESLNSFSSGSFGPINTGTNTAEFTLSTSFQLPVDDTGITGTNV